MATDAPIIDLTSERFWDDPHGAYRAARQGARVAVTPTGEPMFLAHSTVNGLLRDPALESPVMELVLSRNGITSGPVHDWAEKMLLNLVGSEHSRIRGLVARSFSPRRVAVLRAGVVAQVAGRLDRYADGGTLDWATEVAHRIPLWTVCELLGIPHEDEPEILALTRDHGAAFTDRLGPGELAAAEAAIDAMHDYVRRLLAQRRGQPQDDMLSELLRSEGDDGRLTERELVATVGNLLLGGLHSTAAQIAVVVAHLADRPEQLAAVRSDHRLLPQAVEESLRFDPPALSTMRRASHDMEVDGVSVAAGNTVHLVFSAANRDPDVYERPDEFDIRRTDAPPPMTFGFGAHHCIGAALARMEVAAALDTLLARFGSIRRASTEVPWTKYVRLRTITELPLIVEPA